MVVSRFDIFLVTLDPTIGSEIQKTRPCLVISPDEMNRNIRTVIIAPMTPAQKEYPTLVSCTFRKKRGQIVIDQIRTIDKARLIKKTWHDRFTSPVGRYFNPTEIICILMWGVQSIAGNGPGFVVTQLIVHCIPHFPVKKISVFVVEFL